MTDPQRDMQRQSEAASRVERFVLGFFLVGSAILLLHLLLSVWPAVVTPYDVDDQGGSGPPAPQGITILGSVSLGTWGKDESILLVSALLGALGACLHCLFSFARFVGNRALVRSWIWWYFVKLPTGALLAVTFSLLLLGGLLAPSTEQLNPYGVAAISALVGLSTENAGTKLRAVFDSIFSPPPKNENPIRDEEPRTVATDPLRAERIVPDVTRAGGTALVVRILGGGFDESCRVQVDGLAPIEPSTIAPEAIVTQLPAEAIAEPRSLRLVVHRSDGAATDPLILRVEEPPAG